MSRNSPFKYSLRLTTLGRISVILVSLLGTAAVILFSNLKDIYFWDVKNILPIVVPVIVVLFLKNHIQVAFIFLLFSQFISLFDLQLYTSALTIATLIYLLVTVLNIVLAVSIFLSLIRSDENMRTNIKLLSLGIFALNFAFLVISMISGFSSNKDTTHMLYLIPSFISTINWFVLSYDSKHSEAKTLNPFALILIVALCIILSIGLPSILNKIDLDIDLASKTKTCDNCDGKGELPSYLACLTCNGGGQVINDCTNCGGDGIDIDEPCYSCSGSGDISSVCEKCEGEGKIYDPFPCYRCDGSGIIPKYK